jgi:hypothetical protein
LQEGLRRSNEDCAKQVDPSSIPVPARTLAAHCPSRIP